MSPKRNPSAASSNYHASPTSATFCNMGQWFPHPTHASTAVEKTSKKVRNKNSRPATMLTALIAFAGKLGAKFFTYFDSTYPKDSGW